MSIYDSKLTSMGDPAGFVVLSLGATTADILASIPPKANAAWLQGNDGARVAFRLNGQTGVAANECMHTSANEVLELSNRNELELLVVAAGSASPAATDVVIQFFTGRAGARL